ncbi:MAG TPA: HypC/HybG/HupF family hydrogenase formation chaperone [Thermoleophilaceae bacterium]
MSAAVPRCEHDHCITCGDEGLALTVQRVDHARGLALCADEQGRQESVEIGLVDRADPGDRLLVHAGTALLRLDDELAPRRCA